MINSYFNQNILLIKPKIGRKQNFGKVSCSVKPDDCVLKLWTSLSIDRPIKNRCRGVYFDRTKKNQMAFVKQQIKPNDLFHILNAAIWCFVYATLRQISNGKSSRIWSLFDKTVKSSFVLSYSRQTFIMSNVELKMSEKCFIGDKFVPVSFHQWIIYVCVCIYNL